MVKKVLFVASEGLPYIKTGGLADVIGSLPIALSNQGLEVSVVMPLYPAIIRGYMADFKYERTVHLEFEQFNTDCRIFSDTREGVKYYFIENQKYFERDGLYGYYDDGERFSFFQHAVYKMILDSKNYPDLIHSHDWHAGMMAAIARIYYASHKKISKIKQVFTIHNIAFQGNFSHEMLESCLGISSEYYYNGTLRFHNGISFMKAALIYSDKINTVSNTYSYEILDDNYGHNMQEILKVRQDDLWGIVNGINTDEYNPRIDTQIAKKFSEKSLYNKYKNKLYLQERLGLNQDKNVCLLGVVSRLTWQKGISLILEKLPEIMKHEVQFVVLGTGEPEYEKALKEAEKTYKGRMAFYLGYSESGARAIYAGSDLFLMPSLYEPCGISQLIAMRYGTLPIVRETGGLKDTVRPYNEFEKTGNGFSFSGYNSWEFYSVLELALATYYDRPKDFKLLQIEAMQSDVSWEHSAELYVKMYNMA